jgi:hypothetical protein
MRKNVGSDPSLLKHETSGMLSPLFQAAVKAEPGKVVTPDVFGEILETKGSELEEAHLKKVAKKSVKKPTGRPNVKRGGKDHGRKTRKPQR